MTLKDFSLGWHLRQWHTNMMTFLKEKAWRQMSGLMVLRIYRLHCWDPKSRSLSWTENWR